MTTAKEVMSRNVVTLERSAPLIDATTKMVETNIGAIVVCDGALPIGIFSERDLLTRVVSKRLDVATLTLSDVMTTEIYVAQADDDIDRIFEKMKYLNIRHVPIVEGDRFVGVVSIRDLLTAHHRSAHRTNVGSWMTDQPVTATREDALREVIEKMLKFGIGAAVIVDGSEVVGIFTERDLLTKVVGQKRDPDSLIVGEVMTCDPTVASVTDDLGTVYNTLLALNVRHLPIVDKKKLVGIVSMRDVFRMRERVLERNVNEKIELLHNYQAVLEQAHDDRINHLLYETERLRSQSVTDELTGLFNYRYFQTRWTEEFDRARRYQHPLSLCICDIDNFKQLNDAYGHSAGDEVLKDVAKLLANSVTVFHVLSSFRRTDLVARYGGEEFAIILPETDASGALLACERVRNAIQKFSFLAKQVDHPLHVTVSFGIASFPVHAETAEVVFQHADEALYAAKRAGKNRSNLYTEAMAQSDAP